MPDKSNNCYNCDTDCMDSRCDYIGSSAVTVLPDNQTGGFKDGVYTNATIVVSGGYITSVESGKPFEYNPPVCGGGTGGGGNISNTVVINKDAKDGSAATIEIAGVETLPYGQSAYVSNVGTPNAAKLKFGLPEQAPVDITSVISGATGSNTVVTVSNGLVTELTTSTYIATLSVIVNGGYITGTVLQDPVNKDFTTITLDTTGIGTAVETVNQTVSTLELRVAALETNSGR